ncbi:MAG: rpfC [Phycisphaerales bacterium]|nr:rpfC [Phycisphaerales bacterium]MDB5354005.1 rpfC [Phycisphaerales bacterium]
MTALSRTPDADVPSTAAKILIVDDNQATARALAKVMATAHYQTAVSLRGNEAIDYARANPCAAAVVDIHLPDISGLVVSQKLREAMGPNAPIIILSGDTSMEVINTLPHVGATYFFSKPVNAGQLLERLKQWLAAPGGK